LQSRYECQILDSFALDPLFNGLGSLYRFRAPELNMSFPPLVWQTYDVQFTAPRWSSDGSKLRDAHITSWINGVKVQDDIPLPDKTGAGKQEEPLLLTTRFQDHGDPVRFRNIWLVDRGLASGEFPILATQEEREAAAKAEQDLKAQAASAETNAKGVEESQPQETSTNAAAGADRPAEAPTTDAPNNNRDDVDPPDEN
jgi:hypothetical protein